MNDALDLPKPTGPRYLHPSPVKFLAANDECYPVIHPDLQTILSGVKNTASPSSLQLFLRIFLHEKLDGPAMLIASWLLAFVASSPIKYR
ncbi:hypothetical protein [Aquitalea magnusonii]|uniref:hypothetical protein n=1 Tax=Aquitalea magnusonii TaxID=332411 RepID=UPI0011B7D80F|nr:hypothetical protein [Aquitalea magnusonii]